MAGDGLRAMLNGCPRSCASKPLAGPCDQRALLVMGASQILNVQAKLGHAVSYELECVPRIA